MEKILKNIKSLFLSSVFLLPAISLAAAQIITNPLKDNADTFSEFLGLILNIVIEIGTPILVLLFVYIGFKFVIAQGNPGKLQEAKTAFFYGILGAFLVLGAFVLREVISNTLGKFISN